MLLGGSGLLESSMSFDLHRNQLATVLHHLTLIGRIQVLANVAKLWPSIIKNRACPCPPVPHSHVGGLLTANSSKLAVK